VNAKVDDGAIVIVVRRLTTETGRPPTGDDARILFMILHPYLNKTSLRKVSNASV
jgi:hypothetical protein